MGYAVEFEGVSKYYKDADSPAVLDVSLSVDEGEIVTILGSSGCGKTTLLKMVNRLCEPTKGAVRFFGRDVSDMDVNGLRRQIGYVIQQTGLFPHMTVEDNIAVVPRALKWKKADIKERTHELMELVRLDPKRYGKRYPSQLSGGQQQRVGLARALAARPSLMLLDEPFGALDAITRKSLQDELVRIQRIHNTTMLFVTHDIREAFYLGSHIIIMDGGRVIQYGTGKEVIDNPKTEFVRELIGLQEEKRVTVSHEISG